MYVAEKALLKLYEDQYYNALSTARTQREYLLYQSTNDLITIDEFVEMAQAIVDYEDTVVEKRRRKYMKLKEAIME